MLEFYIFIFMTDSDQWIILSIQQSMEDNFLKWVSVFDRFERFASNTDDDEISNSFESNDLIMAPRNTSFSDRIGKLMDLCPCKYLTISTRK